MFGFFWNIHFNFSIVVLRTKSNRLLLKSMAIFLFIYILLLIKNSSNRFLGVSFVFSADQKTLLICTRVTSFALVLLVSTRVTEELHSFLSQSELSNFFVHIIMASTMPDFQLRSL